MHAQIAQEEKRFGFDDIAKAASQKMVRRHPHVFDKRKKISIKEVSENWEKIKQLENKESNSTYPISQELRKKIRSQSAFHGSISISKKSLKNGLNLNKLEDPWGKINEDIFQLKNALSIKNQLIAKHKIGSLICSLINISHQIGIDPEEGIRKNNQEFLTRLQYLESNSHSKSLRELPMLKLKSLWENSKQSISQENY